MASGTTASWSQTAETDPNVYKKKLNALDRESQSAQRQYGDLFSTPVSMQGAQRRAGEQQSAIGEQARRQAASTGLNQLATATSNRKSEVSNATEAAIQKANQFNQTNAEKQRETANTNAFDQKQSNVGMLRDLQKQDFSAYSSATQRSDAIANAWVKGSLDMELTKAANEGKLKVFDIQKASSMYINDLKNLMSDMQMDFEQKRQALIEKYRKTSAAVGGIFTGITNVVGAVANNK